MNKIFEFRNWKKFADNYGPELASLVSLLCIGLTGYAAFKASDKITENKADYEKNVQDENAAYEDEIRDYIESTGGAEEEQEITDELRAEFEKKFPEKTSLHVKKLRKLKIDYAVECILDEKFTILFGAGAVAGEIIGNKMRGDQIAILAGGLGLSQDKLKKLVKKTKETIGEEEFEKIRRDIRCEGVQEAIDKDPILKKASEAVSDDIPGNEGRVVIEKYYDDFTGSLYELPESQVNDAKQAAYEYFGVHRRLEFNKWRSMLGLPDCIAGKAFMFTEEHPFEVKIVPMKYGDVWIKAFEYPTMPDELKI